MVKGDGRELLEDPCSSTSSASRIVLASPIDLALFLEADGFRGILSSLVLLLRCGSSPSSFNGRFSKMEMGFIWFHGGAR